MAAACNISFKIKYTSTLPITRATAFYKLNSSTVFTEYDVSSPLPVSDGTLIRLPQIDEPGEYDLMVELAVNGVTARNTASFRIGKCHPIDCKAPVVGSVNLEENGQIMMNYSVDTENLYAVQYQISTNSSFSNIIQLKVIMGSDYSPVQKIEMNDGTIPNNASLYIRARKHCSESEVSEWSNVKGFRSGTWVPEKTLYPFVDAYCVSGEFEGVDPTDISVYKASICTINGNPLMKKVSLTTPVPQVGSYIYTLGLTPEKPAIPENLADFDAPGGVSMGFRKSGIRWIRFHSADPSAIYNVNPATGQITGRSDYGCFY